MAANGEVVAEQQAECRVLSEKAAVGAPRGHELSRPALAEVELTREWRRVLPAAARQISNIAGHRQTVFKWRCHRRVPEGRLARLCTCVMYMYEYILYLQCTPVEPQKTTLQNCNLFIASLFISIIMLIS